LISLRSYIRDDRIAWYYYIHADVVIELRQRSLTLLLHHPVEQNELGIPLPIVGEQGGEAGSLHEEEDVDD